MKTLAQALNMPFAPVLSFISPLWAVTNAAARKILMPRARRLSRPVISVGNIVAGGVGKTELAIAISKKLLGEGKRVVVASRGYGSAWQRRGGVAQEFASASALRFPDEAMVVLKKAPGVRVAVGANRGDVLERHWEELSPDVVVLDDGFQHFDLARDLDVLVHDFSVAWPVLRDLPSVLGSVRVRIALSDVPKIWSRLEWVQARYRLRSVVNGQEKEAALPPEALLFCGVGNPRRVQRALFASGVRVRGSRLFRDHAAYREEDVRRLMAWQRAEGRDLPLLTTLKDYVKLIPYIESHGGIAGFEPQWIKVSLEFLEGEELLWKAVREATGGVS